VKYVEVPRHPEEGLQARSSTDIKKEVGQSLTTTSPKNPPYRICLAGGWIDQPWVSKYAAGSVVVFNIHPTMEFSERAGLATSSRNFWKGEIWEKQVFSSEPLELAKLLFGYENPPGSQYISGSQDHLGLTLPGINCLHYNGHYWPSSIESITDGPTCDWLESVIRLVPLGERPNAYDPLQQQYLTTEHVGLLGKSGNDTYLAIKERNISNLGKAVSLTHDMWKVILPLTWTAEIERYREIFKGECHGMVTSGCGGGYMILVTEKDIPGSIQLKIRRK